MSAATASNTKACRQLRPGGHLTRVCDEHACYSHDAPVLANTRQLTRHATIDDTP
jgi:hypothetical protein